MNVTAADALKRRGIELLEELDDISVVIGSTTYTASGGEATPTPAPDDGYEVIEE